MLSLTETGSCAYSSPGCRRGGVTSSLTSSDVTGGESSSPISSLSALADASWWPADASTSPVHVVDPARCPDAAAGNSYRHHATGCGWTAAKERGVDGLSHHCHDWTTVDTWPANIDDLLPTSETYKWMTIRRARTRTGA